MNKLLTVCLIAILSFVFPIPCGAAQIAGQDQGDNVLVLTIEQNDDQATACNFTLETTPALNIVDVQYLGSAVKEVDFYNNNVIVYGLNQEVFSLGDFLQITFEDKYGSYDVLITDAAAANGQAQLVSVEGTAMTVTKKYTSVQLLATVTEIVRQEIGNGVDANGDGKVDIADVQAIINNSNN